MNATRTIANVMRAVRAIAVAAPAFLAVACGGSSTTGPGGSSGKARYYMTANIDGAAWAEDDAQASITGARLTGPGIYSIAGYSSSAAITILLTLNTIRGPGTYPLGVNFGVPGGTAQVSNTSSGWTTRLSGAAGSVTIISLTQTEIVGTFTFVANGILNAPSTSTKNVTTGTFDLPVVAVQAVGPIPDNAGSTITGTLAGQPFTMATIAVTTSPTRNAMGQVTGTTLIFGGSNDTQGMGAAISNVNGAGTYALTNKSALEFRHGRGGGQCDDHSLVPSAGQRNLQRDAPRRWWWGGGIDQRIVRRRTAVEAPRPRGDRGQPTVCLSEDSTATRSKSEV
jgi:hypothetical protein